MDQIRSGLEKVRSDAGGSNLIFLFAAHFLFSAWTDLAVWHDSNLTLTNTFLLLGLAWSLHDKSSSCPVMCTLLIEVFGILNDIIVLSIFFPRYSPSNNTRTFAAVMAIFNLIIRFVGIVMLQGEYGARANSNSNNGVGSSTGGGVGTEKGIDMAAAGGGAGPSSVYGRTGPPVQTQRPSSAASGSNMSQISGYGYSQNPYQGVVRSKQEPLPEIPPSYEQHA